MVSLERVTNLFVLGTCGLALFLLAHDRFLQSRDVKTDATIEDATISLPGHQWNRTQHNLILVISPRCHFCIQSAPFYKRLTELRKLKPTAFQFTVLSGDEANVTSTFLSGRGIEPDRIVSAPPRSIGLQSTPTILLLDRRGKVTMSFTGVLSNEMEGKLIHAIGG